MDDDFITVVRRNRIPPTIDLHGYSRKKATQKVEQFLDDHTSRAKKSKNLRIITGRGKHSRNGYAVLKAVTEKILTERGLDYFFDNQGGRIIVELAR